MRGVASLLFAVAAAVVWWEVAGSMGARRQRRLMRSQVGLEVDPDSLARNRAWLSLTAAWAAAAGLIGLVWAGPIGVSLAVVPPIVSRNHRRAVARKRAELLADELAPALRLVVGNLRIGRNLPAAIAEVVESTGEPLRSLLAEVVAQNRLGEPIEVGLDRVAEREDNRHLSIIASAVGLQSRHGGSLVDILEGVVDTIEEEDRLRRDIRTLTADGRLSATVLMLMPPFALVFVSLFDPRYAEPLIAESLGRGMTITAGVLGLVGWRWLRTLSRPEVVA